MIKFLIIEELFYLSIGYIFLMLIESATKIFLLYNLIVGGGGWWGDLNIDISMENSKWC